VQHLIEIASDSNVTGTLRLFEASLTDSAPFDKAIEGCVGLLHIASVVSSKDIPASEFVNTAVNGTLAALDAAKNAKTVKRVVVTSSVSSIYPSKEKGKIKKYTENDWNNVATEEYCTYAYSKVKAEEATIVWFERQKVKPFRYSSVHFPGTFGPQQNARLTSSQMVPATLLKNQFPLIAPMSLNIIDVRDVARGHVHILESESASGRYIIALDPAESSMNLLDVAEKLRSLFPDHPIPYFSAPLPLLSVLSTFISRLDQCLLDSMGYENLPGFDGSKIVKELGFEYHHTNLTVTLKDMGESFFDKGIVVRGSGRLKSLMFPAILALCVTSFVIVTLRTLLTAVGPDFKPKKA